MSLIQNINSGRIRGDIGSKAKYLRILQQKKFKIPVTYVIPNEVKLSHDKSAPKTEKQLLDEFEKKLNPDKKYAVRSSSTLEDRHDFSFAGQFESFLDVSGNEQILDSVKKVWSSGKQVEKSYYYQISNKKYSEIKVGVIVQEMVPALYSGIAFSVNPVSGRDEIIIEATSGKGDVLAQKGETPHRWTYSQNQWIYFDENTNLGQTLLEELCYKILRLKNFLNLMLIWSGPLMVKKSIFCNYVR